mgnify:CR=1 FL=1
MSISIDWGNKIILIPKTYLTYVNGSNYILDTNQFRLTLRELEASENGIVFDETHNHNTEINIGGLTLARTVEIINGYTIIVFFLGFKDKLINGNESIDPL